MSYEVILNGMRPEYDMRPSFETKTVFQMYLIKFGTEDFFFSDWKDAILMENCIALLKIL